MTHSRGGFSLMEIMIAVAIIGLILAAAAPMAMRQFRSAQKSATRTSLRGIQDAINSFNLDTNAYPSSLKDLVKQPSDEAVAKRWEGPYLKGKNVPKDSWGNAYRYQLTPDAENPYELFSYGPNGKKSKKSERLSVWDED